MSVGSLGVRVGGGGGGLQNLHTLKSLGSPAHLLQGSGRFPVKLSAVFTLIVVGNV